MRKKGPIALSRAIPALLSIWCTPVALQAQSQRNVPGESAIIVTAPGAGVDSDDALGLSRADLTRSGQPDLIDALARQLPGVTLQDAQGNPWQTVLLYRGQAA